MENNFLGRGWSFPPTFFAGGAEVALVAGEADIEQCLQILLSTALNERVLASDFGCELSRFLFEEIDQGLINELRSAVSDALLKHEPRIEVQEITVQETSGEAGLLIISVDYHIRTTNNRYNFVFPFYINEATR
ncbi:MAG: GPW/gp25 family protein [Bacteroidota bacterium]